VASIVLSGAVLVPKRGELHCLFYGWKLGSKRKTKVTGRPAIKKRIREIPSLS